MIQFREAVVPCMMCASTIKVEFLDVPPVQAPTMMRVNSPEAWSAYVAEADEKKMLIVTCSRACADRFMHACDPTPANMIADIEGSKPNISPNDWLFIRNVKIDLSNNKVIEEKDLNILRDLYSRI